MNRPILSLGICAALLALSPSCGPSTEKKLADADARIQALVQQGIPDSILSDARIQISMSRGAKMAPGPAAAKAADSAVVLMAAAEKWFEQMQASMPAELAAARTALTEQKAKLTGLQLRSADSVIAVSDSLAKANMVFQARQVLAKLEKLMPALASSEAKAAELKPQLVGTWREIAVNPDGDDFKSVRKTTYVFKPDGKLETQEEKKGQGGPALKEDWKFLSWGTWALRADTVYLFVEREKCERQIYTQLMRDKEGNESWVRKEGRPYDSTVTKSRVELYSDIKRDYKKGK